jgi:hypothetical protein
MGHWRERRTPPANSIPDKIEPWPHLDLRAANDDGDVVRFGSLLAIGARWMSGLVALGFLALRALAWWLAL